MMRLKDMPPSRARKGNVTDGADPRENRDEGRSGFLEAGDHGAGPGADQCSLSTPSRFLYPKHIVLGNPSSARDESIRWKLKPRG